MNIFSKKFKKRVEYFSHGFYCVQYAYYRFLPDWVNIISRRPGAEPWDTRIFTKTEALMFLEGLEGIDDISTHQFKESIWVRNCN